MSDKLSEEELEAARTWSTMLQSNQELALSMALHLMKDVPRFISEIDRLRAENEELREIVRECREYLVTVEHRGSPFKNEDEYPQAKRYCTDYEDCDACVVADTLARIDAATKEG